MLAMQAQDLVAVLHGNRRLQVGRIDAVVQAVLGQRQAQLLLGVITINNALPGLAADLC
jgi:hypothetical protein